MWALRCGGLRWTPDKCGLIWECFYLERRCVSLWCAAGYSSQGHSALAQVCRTFGAPATRLNFKIYQTRWQNQPTAKFIFTPGLSWEIKIPTQTQPSRCWKISYKKKYLYFSLIKLINLPYSEWIQSMRDCKFTFYSSSFHNIWLKCFTMRSISEVVWSRDISAFQIWLLKRGSRPQAPPSLPKDGSPAPRAHPTTLH